MHVAWNLHVLALTLFGIASTDLGSASSGNPLLPLPHMYQATTPPLSNMLTGLEFTINQTWDGQPIMHEPFMFHMQWHLQQVHAEPPKPMVKVFMEGPFMDDPEPPHQLSGICANLWDYEVIELFFANGKEHYLEVEVGPHGHWLVLLLRGRQNRFNKGTLILITHGLPPQLKQPMGY